MDRSECTSEGLKRIVDSLDINGLKKCVRKIDEGYSLLRFTNKPTKVLSDQENEDSDDSSDEEMEDTESMRNVQEIEKEEEGYNIEEDNSQQSGHKQLDEIETKRKFCEEKNGDLSKPVHTSSIQSKRNLKECIDGK